MALKNCSTARKCAEETCSSSQGDIVVLHDIDEISILSPAKRAQRS